MKFNLLLILLLSTCFSLTAQDMVYKPKNPAFGGDTFNYQWLLSSAENQNKHVDKSVSNKSKTELEQFTQSLNSQLLSQVSRSLFAQQFGTDGISVGSYTFGSLAVDVYPSEGGLTVSILDTKTGEETKVIIPKK
ncbi:curli production assembly/transport component CsgF [Flavobacterium sp.]|jgi:curli production assembly/transport component CsgF|uniref:curli production assembly/transport component CsgF n=1 Tax=Flavobacterium sp. TaxID=239 RepID=UPI0022C1F6F4|nr:curli production assembly/transport component CsgF [Flavobacterium sp.]MCZ8228225.1 curli assembly protein CsgF [Flavobacterium sp.]